MKKTVLLALVLFSLCVVGLQRLQISYASPYTDISVATAYNMITNGGYPDLVVLDVRYQYEYDGGHIYGAVWIPYDELDGRIDELAGHENHEIIVYCKAGSRSAIASGTLDSHNFTKVYNMLGGITAWNSAGYPVWIATVHNLNTTFNYDTIQAAIDANQTLDGHTILVDAGTYYEHVVVKKSISLIGKNISTTVIDGNGTSNVIDITAYYVNVTGFTIRNGWNGIFIGTYDYSIISGNIVTDNVHGIYLYATCTCNYVLENTITNNTIKNNGVGISLGVAKDNDIYHNNFINNTQQVYIQTPSYANFWDDGYPSGGNYWSNYTDVDVKSGPNQDQPGSDGIGDTSYVIDANNRDRYPLMYPWDAPPPPSYTLTIYSLPTEVTFTVDGVLRATAWSGTYSEGASVSLVIPEIHAVGEARYPWDQWSDGNTSRSRTVTMNTNITLTAHYAAPYYQLTFNLTLGEQTYNITTLSNSTITSFNFSQTLKRISFNVTGTEGTLGFCNITIPNSLVEDLWQGNFIVLVDGKEPITMNNWTDGTYTYIYFTYLHSEHEVEIIPEFPTWTSMLLILIVLTVAIAIYKRRLLKTSIH